jgi:hypothetical protein
VGNKEEAHITPCHEKKREEKELIHQATKHR